MLRKLIGSTQRNNSSNVQQIAVALLLSAFVGLEAQAEVVKFEVTLDSLWNAETHPIDYPANAHYSAHVGATHNANYSLWSPGELASPGMTTLAEKGLPSPTNSEVAAAIEAGDADAFIQMPAVAVGATNRTFRVSDTHTLISMATMIAPSPDWFIGFHDVNLQDENGEWITDYSADAWPYDAGTDSGASYRSSDLATETPEGIFQITTAPLEGTPRFGVYSISLASIPGDVDESGAVDEGDIRAICSNLGSSDPRFEYTGDDTVTIDDLEAFVETRLDTRMGDTNLDGAVNFDDFLNLSQNFGKDFRDWRRGDFDCNETVEFADFLFLSRHFGFESEENGGEAAAAVPEPSALLMLFSALGLVSMGRRRSR